MYPRITRKLVSNTAENEMTSSPYINAVPVKKASPVNPMRLLGNRVLLLRIEVEDQKSGGIHLADTYKKGSVIFRVLAVGPGRWIKKGRKYVWISPEVKPGDVVGSHHATDATLHPDWHIPHCLDTADGRGRVALDSRFCELIFQ